MKSTEEKKNTVNAGLSNNKFFIWILPLLLGLILIILSNVRYIVLYALIVFIINIIVIITCFKSSRRISLIFLFFAIVLWPILDGILSYSFMYSNVWNIGNDIPRIGGYGDPTSLFYVIDGYTKKIERSTAVNVYNYYPGLAFKTSTLMLIGNLLLYYYCISIYYEIITKNEVSPIGWTVFGVV